MRNGVPALWRRLRPRAATVLRLANAYSGTQSIEAVAFFASAVAEISAGEIMIKFVNAWGRAEDPSEETSLLADVAGDRVDLGWVGTRALGKVGARSLDPLQAPFLITSYEAEAAVLGGDLTRDAMTSLRAIGLEGIAVLGGELRKPVGITRPLLGPADYEAARIRTHASVVGEETLRALGAVPVLRSRTEMARREDVSFDGMDNHCRAIAHWGYGGTLTTNVTLWPRTLTLVASSRTWLRLGSEGQRALLQAGERAANFATAALASQGAADLKALEGTSLELVHADADQVAALRERVEPVYQSLRRDRSTAPLMQRLEELLGQPA